MHVSKKMTTKQTTSSQPNYGCRFWQNRQPNPTANRLLKSSNLKIPTGLGFFFLLRSQSFSDCCGPIRGLHACEARAKVELDRMRRSDRTTKPPRRPLDDEFEGTAMPEGRGRRARDNDRGGNNEGRRSRRSVGDFRNDGTCRTLSSRRPRSPTSLPRVRRPRS